jgi:hypothetical protein
LERESDDRRVSLKKAFDHSDFDQTVDEYLVVARVAWHANGAGDQRGIKTNAATRDIPGESATEEWGTVRLPIDHTTDPYLQMNAIYGSGYLWSGTAVVRIQDLTIVPAESVGTLSDDEILERTAADSQNTVSDGDQTQFEIDAVQMPGSVSEGDPVTATVTITNGPDRSDSQTVSLDVPGVGMANGSASLNPGQSTQLDLTVPTATGDAGTYDVIVSTDDDSVSQTVTVESSPEQNTENETASEPVPESQSDLCQPTAGDPQMQAVQLYTDNTEIEQGLQGRSQQKSRIAVRYGYSSLCKYRTGLASTAVKTSKVGMVD